MPRLSPLATAGALLSYLALAPLRRWRVRPSPLSRARAPIAAISTAPQKPSPSTPGNDAINLSHLILDGIKTAPNGIVLNWGASLTVTHCTVRNFKSVGISLRRRARRLS